jgi:uncharacterized membrane protein (UPF0136 family)
MANIVIWVYVALLVVGGYFGWRKAGSKISLLTSIGCALPLVACALGWLPRGAAPVIIGVLAVFFVYRVIKTRKFMPAGMMVGLSVIALGLLMMG